MENDETPAMTEPAKPTSTIYVILCSGKYTSTINGTPMTGDRVELIAAFEDHAKAMAALLLADVKEPGKWGVRATSVYPVEIL